MNDILNINESGNATKLNKLKVLFMIANNTDLLGKIDQNKVHNDHKKYYKVLKELKDLGVKNVFELDGPDGVEVSEFVKQNYKETVDTLGIFQKKEKSIDSDEFKTLVNECGLTAKIFPTLNESLIAARQSVKAELDKQFNVDGFPLPILKGKLNSVVAPSHSGKTIYGMGLAFSLARAGKKVMFLSTEEDFHAFIDKSMNVDSGDVAWNNISFHYGSNFDRNSWEDFIRAVADDGIEFLVIDYLKKSMWKNYSSDHVVMEEINSGLLKVNAELDNKLGIFAFVQGNRMAFDENKASLEELVKDTSKIALMIDGGMPVYRSADNLLFIKNDRGQRYLVVGKCRRNYDMVGSRTQYDVNLDDMSITMSKTLFDSRLSEGSSEEKRKNKSKTTKRMV